MEIECSSAKKKKNAKKSWCMDAESLLCELWQEKIVELRGVRKNGHIYKNMSVAMEGLGFVFSGEEIHTKINNLTGKYKKEAAKVGSSGGSPSQLRPEKCVDMNSRKVNHEHEVHNTMQMSQSWEDLTLVAENWSCKSSVCPSPDSGTYDGRITPNTTTLYYST